MGDFTNILNGLIEKKQRYSGPRLGQVLNLNDPLKKGRVLSSVPILGADTDDKGVWCYPAQNNALVTPSVGDWIIIMWIDSRGAGGQDIRPFYVGRAVWMSDQIPQNYQDQNSQVVFEGTDNGIHISYSESNNKMEIGNAGFQPAARKEDSTTSDITLDSTFWGWVANISAVVNGLLPGSVPTIPTSQAGKINSGSDQVEIGGK